MILDVVIPGEPVAWPRAKYNSRQRRFYVDDETQAAKRRLAVHVGVLWNQANHGEPHKGPISVEVVCVLAVPASWSKAKKVQALSGTLHPTSRPDVDNYAKLVMDALNGIAWVDDAQVVQLSVAKCYGEQPETRLHLWGR